MNQEQPPQMPQKQVQRVCTAYCSPESGRHIVGCLELSTPNPKGAAELMYNLQLRDLFAAHIMPVFIRESNQSLEDCAMIAYVAADALIAARSKPNAD